MTPRQLQEAPAPPAAYRVRSRDLRAWRDFCVFWRLYPRKDGKLAAWRKWRAAKISHDELRMVVADVVRRSRSRQWQEDRGEYIPWAKTYIYNRIWEDGAEEPTVPLLVDQGGRANISLMERQVELAKKMRLADREAGLVEEDWRVYVHRAYEVLSPRDWKPKE